MPLKRILIIQDQYLEKQLLIYSLIDEGFGVSYASQVSYIDEMLQSNEPDLIIIDWQFRQLPPMILINKVKHLMQGKIYRFLVILPNPDHQLESDLRQEGVDDFIVKPFEPEFLVQKVHTLISGGHFTRIAAE